MRAVPENAVTRSISRTDYLCVDYRFRPQKAWCAPIGNRHWILHFYVMPSTFALLLVSKRLSICVRECPCQYIYKITVYVRNIYMCLAVHLGLGVCKHAIKGWADKAQGYKGGWGDSVHFLNIFRKGNHS